MTDTSALVGRDELIAEVVREIRKGKHAVLTGAVGIGKSAVMRAALKQIEPRPSEWYQFDPVAYDAGDYPEAVEVEQRPPTGLRPPTGSPIPASGDPGSAPRAVKPPPADPVPPQAPERRERVLVYLSDHQAKGQFVQMARRLIETGLLKPSALELAKRYDALPPRQIDWAEIRRHVNRLSIRDLTAAIIPALYAYEGRVLIAVDDMTSLTPTQQAFWLAVFEHAQVVTCASARKTGLRKLWWKMKAIEIPALAPEASKTLVRDTIARQGMLIESPELYVGHVVKQAGGNPQAIIDMMDESSKERVVDKRRIREMKHQAGIRYADFTPVMIIAGALVVATRYLAIGLGDTALYVLAGLGAALFLSVRFFMARGTGRVTA
jgi:energy-coupling factor transporter ATP-binding protein EcfA2